MKQQMMPILIYINLQKKPYYYYYYYISKSVDKYDFMNKSIGRWG